MKILGSLLLGLAAAVGQTERVSIPPTETVWKQLRLLESRRGEVERLVGASKSKAYIITYPVEGGDLDVEYYSFDHCNSRYGYRGFWNVPEWTVIAITYTPDNPANLSSLNLELRKFRAVHKSPHVPDVISYVNDEEGVDYTFQEDNTLNYIRYFPPLRDNRLRCTQGARNNNRRH